MNLRIIGYLLGWVLKIEGLFLVLPLLVGALYEEPEAVHFLMVLLPCLLAGYALTRRKPKNTVFFAREGFCTVALSWIVLSLVGALPFFVSGCIPHFADALFETISGFTTTGASILSNVEALPQCMLFWRSLTHWLGGMGVLVFILAVLPLAGGHSIYLLRAESPGPSVSKLVPRLRDTAMLLYTIYIVMTLIEIVLLLAGGMPIFDAVTTSFGTAGTGGFGIKNDSIGSYSHYIQFVISIFMILFGVNFNIYYLGLCRKFDRIYRNEELRFYLGIIAASVLLITVNSRAMFSSSAEAAHHALFQVASIITTTGFSTTDFNLWPAMSKAVLVILMFVGACAGSTGGGIKCSRIVLLAKSVKKEMHFLIHPRSVKIVKYEDKRVAHEIVRSVNVFLITYFIIFTVSCLAVALDNFDLETTFTSVAATLNNIGPGLSIVGPTGNFGDFSLFSKFVLMFDMLAGRLELFPLLILFMPATWRRH